MIMILNHNQCKWIWKINTSYTQHSEKTTFKMMFLLSRLLYVFLKTQVHVYKQNGINMNILLCVFI